MPRTAYQYFHVAMLLAWASFCLGQSAFFPVRVLGENEKADDFKIQWYSKFLSEMHEPSLWENSKMSTPLFGAKEKEIIVVVEGTQSSELSQFSEPTIK